MEAISGLALMLLTLVAYSAGATVAAGRRKVTPDLVDIVAIAALWSAALASRGGLGRWLAIGVWPVIGLAAGAAGAGFRRRHYTMEKEGAPKVDARWLQALWAKWKAFGLRMGNYQSRVLLTLFYFFAVTPFAVGMRLFSNPLRPKADRSESAWSARERPGTDLESARSQF